MVKCVNNNLLFPLLKSVFLNSVDENGIFKNNCVSVACRENKTNK
jgi:hypothetical protein